jgi:hypothetical protein
MKVKFIESKSKTGINHLSIVNNKTGGLACSGTCITKYFNSVNELEKVHDIVNTYEKDPDTDEFNLKEYALLMGNIIENA